MTYQFRKCTENKKNKNLNSPVSKEKIGLKPPKKYEVAEFLYSNSFWDAESI